jgi:hypothetical protein
VFSTRLRFWVFEITDFLLNSIEYQVGTIFKYDLKGNNTMVEQMGEILIISRIKIVRVSFAGVSKKVPTNERTHRCERLKSNKKVDNLNTYFSKAAVRLVR